MASDPGDTLEELAARLRKVEKIVDELDTAVAEKTITGPRPKVPTEPRYPAVEPWVRDHFTAMYIRPLGGVYRWCAQWWDHAEAISRLEALWRCWEVARLDPIGMSAWYRDHLDHHLPILLGATGPFSRCTPERHEPPTQPLPTTPAPEGWWKPST